MYSIDDKAAVIRDIQKFLFTLHYFTDTIPFTTIDGIYGAETKAAVRAYQRHIGLVPTGIVDAITFARLFEDYRAAATALSGTAFIPPNTPLPATVGSTGVGIRNLQNLLNALLERYGRALRTDIGGIFSYATEQAVNEIRKIYLLPQDGTVTNALFQKMIRDYENPTASITANS